MTSAPQDPVPPAPQSEVPPAPLIPSDGIVPIPIAGVVEQAPGVPGTVSLTGAHGLAPKIEINGKRASKGMGQVYKVPMQDGSVGKLKMSSTFPGFPRLDFEGKRIFEIPTPPTGVTWVLFLPLLYIVLAFGIVGVIMTFALHYLFAWMIKRPTWARSTKVLLPAGITLLLAQPIIWLNEIVASAIFG